MRSPGKPMDVTCTVAEAAAALLGGVDAVGLHVSSDAEMARARARGFTVKAIDALRESGVTETEVGSLIIKSRTLSHRRANGSRLTVDESDRAARVARCLVIAERTFAGREKANPWLRRSLDSLGGQAPMSMLRTEAGARVVENLLARIAWGAGA